MTAALWPAVVNGLQTAFAGATSWPVFDGIPITYEAMDRGIAVGIEATQDDGMSGEIRQDWRDAGPAPNANRYETGTVKCSIWRQSGDDDLAALRADVFACLDQLMTVAAAITPLGVAGLVNLAPLQVARPVQQRTEDGVIVEVAFDVGYSGVLS